MDEPVFDILLNDSTELWLMQWPINHLKLADFHGKEVSLELHKDGALGNLEGSSGKSYELVSFAAQEPDVTVFLPSGSETKAVGKISRRVSLVRYPGPEEIEKSRLTNVISSSHKSSGSSRKSRSRYSATPSKHQSSHIAASALFQGQGSTGPSLNHKQKSSDAGSMEISGRSTEGSRTTGGEKDSIEKELPQPEKSKRKRVKIASSNISGIS